MTWPFENDTSAIIKKLASAQLKKERLKKIFTIIAISLATFLMASVLLLVSGIITVNQNGGNNITGSYHALISSIEKEQSINEQISNFAQTYPTNLKASSNEALLFMRRYRFANCSCFSCCFKDAYPSSNVQ